MKKGKSLFLKQKSYLLAVVLMLAAVFGMTGVYMSEQRAEKEQLAQAEKEKQLAEAEKKEQEELAAKEAEKQAAFVEREIMAQNDDFLDDPGIVANHDEEIEVEPQKEANETEAEEITEEPQQEETQETASGEVQQELHFHASEEMGWPLQGNVIMNYSMEQTVYFATLDQYKYNPAIVIQGKVNDKVRSVADGKVTNIETNAETGCTVTVDLGDGYSAVYGQLKEVPFQIEDYVKSGDIIGYVSEPTKYYSVEGANLYFQILKDGVSVDPMEFLQ